jgi:hypothetical protein
MLFATRDTLFLYLFVFLLFLPALIALARNFRTILSRSVKRGHPCLIPDFRGNSFSFSPGKYDVGCRFVTYILYNVEVHSFYS